MTAKSGWRQHTAAGRSPQTPTLVGTLVLEKLMPAGLLSQMVQCRAGRRNEVLSVER